MPALEGRRGAGRIGATHRISAHKSSTRPNLGRGQTRDSSRKATRSRRMRFYIMKVQTADVTERFRSLLKRHSDLVRAETARLSRAFDGVFSNFLAARKTWAKKQRVSADDFNLFELMRLDGDEVNHSRLLAWLLD